MLNWTIAHFIVGYSAVINANNQLIAANQSIMDEKEAKELFEECFLFKFQFEGESPEPSMIDEFFEKHSDQIAEILERIGVSDFIYELYSGDEDTWGRVIKKIYQFLPLPLRTVVSEEKFTNIILSNKERLLKRLKE